MTESKTNLEIGVWFEDQRCWMYKGTLPVVLQIEKREPTPFAGRVITSIETIVSRCPACEASRIRTVHGFGKVKRWLILPP